MPSDMDDKGWAVWANYVLKELERLNTVIELDIRKKSDTHDREISALLVKSGMFGLVGGLIPAVVTLLIVFLRLLIGS